MTQIANTPFSKMVRRMLGFGLDAWNKILVVFLLLSAVAAVIAGISTWVVIKLQKLEAQDAAERIAQLNKGTEQLKADNYS